MRAMTLMVVGQSLEFVESPDPIPGPGEILVRIEACGVCRTDLHVLDGELPDIRYPVIPGHEIVGIVEKRGEGVREPAIGERVGVPWLGHANEALSDVRAGRIHGAGVLCCGREGVMR